MNFVRARITTGVTFPSIICLTHYTLRMRERERAKTGNSCDVGVHQSIASALTAIVYRLVPNSRSLPDFGLTFIYTLCECCV